MTTTQWSSSGTAFARFREKMDAADALPPPRWEAPPPLPLEAHEQLPNAASLHQLAWELARLAPAGLHRDLLLHLGLAMLAIAHDGSTSVPLDAAGRKAIDERLALSAPNELVRAAIETLLNSRSVPAPLAPFIGERGDKPILLDARRIRLHRFDRMEQRLAEALAALVGQGVLPVDDAAFGQAIDAVRADAVVPLTAEQQLAIVNAAHLPFSVISGGPGTGKTTIVVSLLRLLHRLGVPAGSIALAAPTGKAANRMYEVVCAELGALQNAEDQALLAQLPEPRTLHRLLGYMPSTDRFRHDEHNPLEQQLVIIDESSMVDLFLMHQLLRSCSRAPGAPPRRLVLLGDGNQLPSVEAGMVLDLLTAPGVDGPVPLLQRPWQKHIVPRPDEKSIAYVAKSDDPRAAFLTTLTHSHRMDPKNVNGKPILQCANAIRDGRVELLSDGSESTPTTRDTLSALAFAKVEHVALSLEEEAPEAFFEVWRTRRLEAPVVRAKTGETSSIDQLRRTVYRFSDDGLHLDDAASMQDLLASVDRQRILCLNRGQQPSGAETANTWFSEKRRRRGRELAASILPLEHRSSHGWFAGEPVLFTVNDYGLNLFNGDHGVLAWTSRNGDPARLRAVFPRAQGVLAFDLESVQAHLQRAYALTVHKAQGSQVTSAALLLPAEFDNPLLVRQLVYTAVSRASQSVVLVGDLERLKQSAGRPVVRFCGVLDRLRELLTSAEVA